MGKNLVLALWYLALKLRQSLIFTTKRKNDMLTIADYSLSLESRHSSAASNTYEAKRKQLEATVIGGNGVELKLRSPDSAARLLR